MVWILTVRNPVDRILSWYEYEHPQRQHSTEIVGNRILLYEECYSTMYELSTIGLQLAYDYDKHNDGHNDNYENNNSNSSSNKQKKYSYTCGKRAYQAITGQVGFQYHNYYNYQYYMDWIAHVQSHYLNPSSDTLRSDGSNINSTNTLVLRTEHLEEDWNQLEDMYNEAFGTSGGSGSSSGGRRSSDSYFERLHQSNSTTIINTITNSNATESGLAKEKIYPNLCRALCNEIKVYTALIENAINLTPNQKQQSFEELYDKCPMYKTSESTSQSIQCIDAPIQQYQEDEDDNVEIITNPEYPKMT